MKPPAPHSFREKTFRRGGACAACREPLGPQGLVCRVCKVTSHKKCEAKVTSPCQALPPPELRRNTAPPARRSEHLGSTKSLNSPRQRNTLPRSCSLEQVLERRFECDLTYVTERILSLRFPAALDEPRYRGHLRDVAHMLASRHRDRYMLFNLSEKRRDITRLHPKVQDFGWPDLHAPPLDKLCSICKALEAWLRAHPQHVAVLHCKGSKGKTGVIVAAYMHYSKVSASADQALGTLMMRKFFEEKVAAALQPSQRRYIAYFGGLLSGSIRMNSSPLFLHHVLLPALRHFEPGHGFQPFLKIYQSLQLVYTSGVYISGPGPQSLCVNLEPALLLKGDVMVKCYHRRARGAGRHAVFRAQFHTCTLQGARLRLRKDELDDACGDERFPPDATVEFIFSSGPERIKGWESLRSPPSVSVDLSVGDPAVRWDSYEGFNLHHQDSLEDLSHTRGPLDGSPYARVQKQRAPSPWSPGWDSDPPTPPDGGPGTPPSRPPPPTAAERQELERLLGGFGVREGPPGDRETPILEDERPNSAPCSTPVPHGSTAPCGTPTSYGTPTSHGSPASHGTPTFQGTPASHGSPTSRGTPISHGTTASHGSPTFQGSPSSHGTPISCGTTAPYGSPTSHVSLTPYGTPISHGTPITQGTPTPQGTPTSHESPTPYGSPTFLGSPASHGSPTFYGTPTPYGSQISHGTPTSYGSPTSHGTPMSHGTPTSYGSLMSHGTPTFQGTPASHRTTALYGPPAPHSPPAPPLCRRASLAPPCSCHPRYGAEGGLGGPGGGEKRGVQRSLSEGLPPCGYGRRGGGCLLLEELPPPCPCPDCQGPPPIYGVHLERGGERWGGSPRPPAPGEALEPPPCPRCGRAGPGGGRGPPRDPYGNVGYDPPALEAREGYGIPGQPDPPERRSPGEGGPWRGTPEVPPPLHQPPRDPDPPSTLRGGPAEPPPPSSAHGSAGEVPGSPTPAFPPPAAYCAPPSPQPPLPEKRHPPAPGGPRDRASPPQTHSSPGGAAHACQGPPEPDAPTGVTFVQDTSKFWYKPGLSRDQAVSLLKGRPPGAFLVRLSSSFPGAYGLALKVAAPPPRCRPPHNGDPQEQLVRHFLIETGPRGVKIKGCPDEPHFGSLPALVLQHSITPISLPCALRIPSKDLLEETLEGPGPPNMSTAADLLRQGAACSVRFLGSVETESLTGPQAVAKAVGSALGGPPRPPPCTVHFKVSAQGITLTDSQRKLFFRRHYPVSSVTFCSTDPQDRRWTNPDGTTSKIFGFVAKVAGGPGGGNACHVFAELDPEQPAGAIVTFVTKVLLGTHRK